MCNRSVLVPIPDFLVKDFDYIFDAGDYSPNGEFDIDAEGHKCFRLDACIVPAVKTLWAAGIRTIGCCCGHGSGHGCVSIEVPNGGDEKRRDDQTAHFYASIAEHQDLPIHNFRGSKHVDTNN